MTAVDDLLAQIFDGLQPGVYGEFRTEFESWVRDLRRFREFAGSNRSKIRAKLKSARDEGGLLDVRAELQTALLLLGEERFTLEYEVYAAAKQRGPDYTVTFKTHTPFNVEVRRIRAADLGPADLRAVENGGAGTPRAANPHMGKLMAVLCDKVGQMPPSIVNLLWLAADGELADEAWESFPSGHAALAFCSATAFATLALELVPDRPETPWLIGGAYLLACGTSGLRVASGQHFIGDVAAGAVLGSAIGWLTVRLHAKASASADSPVARLQFRRQGLPILVLSYRLP